jgi:hypothetical protein
LRTTPRAEPDRLEQVRLADLAGEHHDPGPGSVPGEAAQDLEPAEPGHPQVE